MESWLTVWHEGLAPLFSTETIRSLKKALETDDKRIVQHFTSLPNVPEIDQGRTPAEGACLIGFCNWQEEELTTVEQIETSFVETCAKINHNLKEWRASGVLVAWFDSTSRAQTRKELLIEVNKTLEERESQWKEETSGSVSFLEQQEVQEDSHLLLLV